MTKDTTTPATPELSVDEARRILAEHDAAELAAMAKAEAQRAAEEQRRDRRRHEWARQFLADDPAAKITEARQKARAAKFEFARALAESPWFAAMIAWQQAEFDVRKLHDHREVARHLAEGRNPVLSSGAGALVSWLDGRPRFDELLRIMDATLHEHTTHDGPAELEDLIAGPDGPDDPLTQTS